jgi:hypothetical protein
MQSDLDQIIAFEAQQIHYQSPPPDDNPRSGIAIRTGSQPVMFSAPHSCRHKRANRWKQEDEYTAAIAEWLHQRTGAHAIYLTHQINPDPHDDGPDNIYKQALAAFLKEHPVRLVIDLHGTRPDRDFGVALGTMKGRSCPQHQPLIIAQIEAHGFRIDETHAKMDRMAVNHPRYTGGLSRPTITRFVVEELGLPAVQIELNAWIRILKRLPNSTNASRNRAPNFEGDAARFLRVMDALTTIAHQISQ